MLENIDAVIFDIDGTLIDSMHVWTDIDENKKMESELNESKRLYDSIRSSRSWKMTKRFRK